MILDRWSTFHLNIHYSHRTRCLWSKNYNPFMNIVESVKSTEVFVSIDVLQNTGGHQKLNAFSMCAGLAVMCHSSVLFKVLTYVYNFQFNRIDFQIRKNLSYKW